ncbi:hypothetical protein CN918_28375 [Priestia megaterium]|nr:hypothetical protein CN918_28375 [Priestia megaterium]
MEILVVVVIALGALFGFNWLMGYKKGNIQLDLDNRYIHLNDYVKAIKQELTKQGKDVMYNGNRIFTIDKHQYVLVERNVSMGGVPLQHTVLKRLKGKEV